MMKRFKIVKLQLTMVLIAIVTVTSCVEPIDVGTLDFEEVLVVEALITNEHKKHQIKLTKSFTFEEEQAPPVTNAQVSLVDDQGGVIDFYPSFVIGTGIDSGIYQSNIEFAAEPNKAYQLVIQTADGKRYESRQETLTAVTQIDDVYAVKGIDNLNNEGMQIFVDSHDPSGNSNYYRYQFEETYKIVAPYWVPRSMIVNPYPPYSYEVVFRNSAERVCYNTAYSNDIIQTQTTDLAEDHVQGFMVRFIPSDDPIISYRYSILVKQYVQSLDAHTYFKTLKKMSSSGNVFTQQQPGFIQGNLYSVDNPKEKVIGMFEVSSVSEKRMFFNYTEFYPGENRPPYFVDCPIGAPSASGVPGDNFPPPLQQGILSGYTIYLTENDNYPNPLDENEGPELVVPKPCGDCTELGTATKPDFWVE